MNETVGTGPRAWPGDRVLIKLRSGTLRDATVKMTRTEYTGQRQPFHLYRVRPDYNTQCQWVDDARLLDVKPPADTEGRSSPQSDTGE